MAFTQSPPQLDNPYLGDRVLQSALRRMLPHAPASSVVFLGNGNNVVYLDWEHDLLIVSRWIDSLGTLDAMVAALDLDVSPQSSGRPSPAARLPR